MLVLQDWQLQNWLAQATQAAQAATAGQSSGEGSLQGKKDLSSCYHDLPYSILGTENKRFCNGETGILESSAVFCNG